LPTNELQFPVRAGSFVKVVRTGVAKIDPLSQVSSPLVGPRQYTICNNDVSTALRGVLTRVIQPVPLMNVESTIYKKVRRKILTAAKKLAVWVQILSDEELMEVINEYPAKKRDRYTRALKSLKIKPLDKTDARLKMFVKDELQESGELPDEEPDPRIIHYRSDRYCLSGRRFVHKLERGVYAARAIWNPTDWTSECAKNKSPKQRAEEIKLKLRKFKNPVIVGLDGKRWDAHITEKALELEHLFYKEAMKVKGIPGFLRKQFSDMLRWQVDNRVTGLFSDGKLKYNVKAGRMSGDFNTALGNVILMSAYSSSILEELGVPRKHYSIFDDGDDVLLILEQEYVDRVLEGLPQLFLDLGQEIKIESVTPASDVENIKFCSHRLLKIDGSLLFVRNPIKVIAGYFLDGKWFNNREDALKFWNTVGYADALMYRNVPILSVLFSKFRGNFDMAHPVLKSYLLDIGKWRHLDVGISDVGLDGTETKISDSSRASMWKAYGISPTEQYVIEEQLNRLDLHELLVSLPERQLSYQTDKSKRKLSSIGSKPEGKLSTAQ
jgi:hypothetical protein